MYMDDYSVIIYRVGQHIPDLASGQDSCMAQYIGGTLAFHILINHPNEALLRKADIIHNKIRLSLFTYRDVVTFAIKIGNLNWMDAPYTPHLDQKEDLPNINSPSNQALLVLIDSSDGQILRLRTFELPAVFARKLSVDIKELHQKPFSIEQHINNVQAIQNLYLPRDIGERMQQATFILREQDTN